MEKLNETQSLMVDNDNLIGRPNTTTLTGIAYYSIAFYLITISVVGIALNSAVIFVFYRCRNVQTNSNYFVIALCFCGLLISVLGIPFAAASAVLQYWFFGDFGCKLHAFLLTGLGITMIAIFTAIAGDRYIAVVRYYSQYKMKRHQVFSIIASCFTYGGLWSLFPLMGWSGYTEEIAHISCAVDWELRDPASRAYSVCLMIAGLILPITVITVLYIQIVKLLKARNEPPGPGRNVCGRLRQLRMVRRERKVTCTIITMIAAFVITWLPYSIFSTITLLGYGSIIPPLAQTLPSMFAKSSVLWNPIIFAIRNKSMGQAFLTTFPWLVSCRNIIPRNSRKVKFSSEQYRKAHTDEIQQTTTTTKSGHSSTCSTESILVETTL